MKKLTVIGVTIAIIGLMVQFPHIMINPGELAKDHQKLNNKCFACHKPFGGIANEKCISCHHLKEIGKDTFNQSSSTKVNGKILFHEQLSAQQCSSCHTDHAGINPENKMTNFKHELLTADVISNCNSCHSKPDDKLHATLKPDCNSCHNTKGWKTGVVFNHDNIQGTDKQNCTSCHSKPADSYHAQLIASCDKCHSTSKWVPSTFDHSNYFQLDQNHNAKCITCHTNNNFAAYTCYGCHEHSESNIISKHNEEGIPNINNCVSCHKSGNENDIKNNQKSTNENGKYGNKERDDEKDND